MEEYRGSPIWVDGWMAHQAELSTADNPFDQIKQRQSHWCWLQGYLSRVEATECRWDGDEYKEALQRWDY